MKMMTELRREPKPAEVLYLEDLETAGLTGRMQKYPAKYAGIGMDPIV